MGSTTIIAEAGVNHNGSLAMAFDLIDAAVDAGADVIKFQSFRTHRLVTKYAPKADYQQVKNHTGEPDSQLAMLQRLELDEDSHRALASRCADKGIRFLSTPFDLESLDLLCMDLGLNQLKISSGDITNAPLLLRAAAFGKQVILSTGASMLGEIEEALATLAFGYVADPTAPSRAAFRAAYQSVAGQAALQRNVTLLHCTSDYPTPLAEVNLRVLHTLQSCFGLPVGLSDHTKGTAVATAAVALGATVVEKHFTLSNALPGPDHQASLEPDELRAMVQNIRAVETAIGGSVKYPTPSEARNLIPIRKSIVAACPIRRGEFFTAENLTVKRPGGGLSPMQYWDVLGRVANKDYLEDQQVSL